ncbi:F-box/kelch-repeat protein At3g06240-like [Macadamia integrifolia]|uniref:F-box/kelch-repeat protein At3g06240-like n=1 Tax=Macadamia integrifolia TaxID=60698 RepID=UPI001C4ED5AF|nr:F-box/kelch-repeat protein At3g06240-like [Macadamia integrifolia]
MVKNSEKIRQEEEAMPNKNLPEVLIMDILSRLPVKSLLRFRCVSKPRCALITDPPFIKMHLSQSLAKAAAVELDHPLKSPDYGTEVPGSCNGLLCINTEHEENIYLWNPSTRWHQKLPFLPLIGSSTTAQLAYGFGYEPITNDYKLVRILQRYPQSYHNKNYSEDDWSSEVRVYSLSTNSWIRIGVTYFHRIQHRFGVLANSVLHWIGNSELVVHTTSNSIVSFDLKDEKYREVPLPDFSEDIFHMTMGFLVGFLGGQLCVICNFSIHDEIWVMKDYNVRGFWEMQGERASADFKHIRIAQSRVSIDQ